MTEPDPTRDAGDDTLNDEPPVLGSWNKVYLLVVVQLVVMVLLLYAVTRWAS